MAPEVLRALNVAHFERLLLSEREPDQRRVIEQLLAEERAKPLSAYPCENSKRPGAGNATGLT
ncbi:hypothetical protein [Phenylobacterium sp.]|uniref:hypothetical protein n=1 Tax=Phenylobacterium sp. TaxID=1871053 RepID=UPI003BAD499D